jgi:UDP-N-acetylglucosamine transferase subunit ALG13
LIFVTVGTQLPFDRLVAAVDRWAGAHSQPERRVFGQIGPTDLRPRHIEWRDYVSPAECQNRMREARVIVAHAGMGTILSALELGKPLVVMPRRAALGEHRNDHQLATARRLAEIGGLNIAFDEGELARTLDSVDRLGRGERIGQYAADRFVSALRAFIAGESRPLAGSR